MEICLWSGSGSGRKIQQQSTDELFIFLLTAKQKDTSTPVTSRNGSRGRKSLGLLSFAAHCSLWKYEHGSFLLKIKGALIKGRQRKVLPRKKIPCKSHYVSGSLRLIMLIRPFIYPIRLIYL